MNQKLTFKFPDKCRFLGYTGPKAAIEYCIAMNLGPSQTAFQLQSTWHTVKKYATLYGLELTRKGI